VTLTFEGVGNGTPVGSFYNGGPGGDVGITFGFGASGLVDGDAGGSGFFANEPSPSTVLHFSRLVDGAAFIDVEQGFRTAVEFSYSQPDDPTQPDTVFSHFVLAVFDGFGGTGRELGRWTLPGTDPSASGDPTGGLFGTFASFRGSFQGTGQSLGFFEARSSTGAIFDDLQFDLTSSSKPVPEPASLILVGTGVVALAMRSRARKR
jgi:hypothetical protein